MVNSSTITCTRCGSVVPWGPYCTQCSAYLEFAGQPPWKPDAPAFDTDDAPTTDMDVIAVDATEGISQSTTSARAEDFDELFRPAEPMAESRPEGRDLLALVGIASVGVLTSVIAWWSAGPWATAFILAFLTLWCVLFIRSWTPREVIPMVAVTSTVTYPEVDWERPYVEDVEVVGAVAETELLARAPQELPSQVVERTVASATRSVHGNRPCPDCSQLNEADRIFCDWCGSAMPGADLGPELITAEIAKEREQEVRTSQAKEKRKLSKSWRTPIIILTLFGVFASAIIFALFGPNSFRVQFGITQVYQAIGQFINPYSGTIVTPVEVDASSTLPGTLPLNSAGGDARTFWASDSQFGFGVGTTLIYRLPEEVIIDRMTILPGVQGSQFGPRALATPKDITLSFDDGSTFETTLLRVNADRDFRQLVKFPRTRTETVTLTINSIYPPSGEEQNDFGEVALSGVEFLSPSRPPEFLRLPTEIQTTAPFAS